MSDHWMPFTAQFRLHPARPPKRFERVRELQRIGYFIHQALIAESTLNIALPGGGQARNFGQWSDLVYGSAVKPQFGETPAQATVTGFWYNGQPTPIPSPSPDPRTYAIAPQPQRQLLHAGAWVTGPYNQTPVDTNPDHIIQVQVKTLVTLLESLVNAGLPAGIDPIQVFRLEYYNIVWGDRGQHFPR